jgi:hypothetical protein
MRAAAAIVTSCILFGGCAGIAERQSLGYGDYVAFTCDQLGQEAVRLMRETRNRSEHLLGNDQDRRATATTQLKAVKQASAAKQC